MKRYLDIIVKIKKNGIQVPKAIWWDDREIPVSRVYTSRKVIRDEHWCWELGVKIENRPQFLYWDIDTNRWFMYTDQSPNSDYEYEGC